MVSGFFLSSDIRLLNQCERTPPTRANLYRQFGEFMRHPQPMEQIDTPKHRGRGWLLWLGGCVVLTVVLLLVGALYESAAETADARVYLPPGQLVDVGGYHLHVNCTGTGSPTVVIDAGLGDWSTVWSWVQPEVAQTTRVCTYDRAGSGWSEAGPQPRTAQAFVSDLHAALTQAAV